VPVYEYYCRVCNAKFERLAPMRAAADPAECPSGHEGALRTISLMARPSTGDADSSVFAGGCGCGGACSCGSYSAN
jgi:putative FmdB family regulatory protein